MADLSEDFEKWKIVETLVDPHVSSILVELETGEKDSEYLAEKLQTSPSEIKKRLSYVIKHGLIVLNQKNGKEVYAADFEKLNKIMESDDNFSGVVDGLTELDQYLN